MARWEYLSLWYGKEPGFRVGRGKEQAFAKELGRLLGKEAKIEKDGSIPLKNLGGLEKFHEILDVLGEMQWELVSTYESEVFKRPLAE